MTALKHRLTRKYSPPKEKGVVTVLFALVITAIFFGLVLALDGALYTSQNSNLKSVADITALSVLDAYAKNPVSVSSGIPSESVRRTLARDYGDYILGQHKLISSSSPLSGIGLSGPSTSDLRLGSYFPDSFSALGSGTPCDAPGVAFPCWAESTALPLQPSDSVLVTLRTAASDPIVGFVSSQPLNLEATSVATVVESCLVTAIDVSSSVVDQSHNPGTAFCFNYPSPFFQCPTITTSHPEYVLSSSGNTNPNNWNPAVVYTEPLVGPIGSGATQTPAVSFFVYDADIIMPGGAEVNCSLPNSSSQVWQWCAMHENRSNFASQRGVPVSSLPRDLFFRSDYVPVVAGGGIGPQKNLLVNAYAYPEPFRTFMLTANATSRLLFGASSQHSALTFAFTGEIGDRALPLPNGGQFRLSRDMRAMAQLTNLEMMAAVDDTGAITRNWQYPNLMDWLFFNDSTATGPNASPTNVTLALNQAAEAIAASNQPPTPRCGDRASKQILLMTDGISTCSYFDSTFSAQPNELDCGGVLYPNMFDRYIRSEVALMTDMVSYLSTRGVVANVMLSLPGVRYKNLIAPGKTSACASVDTDEACFVSPWTAGQFSGAGGSIGVELPPPSPSADPSGFDLGTCDPATAFIDCSSEDPFGTSISDESAFTAVANGDESFRFRRPSNVLARLAYLTGGIYCPLIPLSGVSVSDYVDHDGDHSPGSGCPFSTSDACCQDSVASGRGSPCILRNTARVIGSWETRPPVYADTAGQAYLCAVQAVGLSPYVVKKPKQIFCPSCN